MTNVGELTNSKTSNKTFTEKNYAVSDVGRPTENLNKTRECLVELLSSVWSHK